VKESKQRSISSASANKLPCNAGLLKLRHCRHHARLGLTLDRLDSEPFYGFQGVKTLSDRRLVVIRQGLERRNHRLRVIRPFVHLVPTTRVEITRPSHGRFDVSARISISHLISLNAGRTGLNLVAADSVIH
jgi:hypothetical protein